MCLRRDENINLRVVNHTLFVIDLTMEDPDDINEPIEDTPQNDQLNYPYNLLPSSDEEELSRDLVDHMEESNEDHTLPNTTARDSLQEINHNFYTMEEFDAIRGQEFEMDIPQILLSMSRISNNLNEQAAASHN